jgi:hypothetical protein
VIDDLVQGRSYDEATAAEQREDCFFPSPPMLRTLKGLEACDGGS